MKVSVAAIVVVATLIVIYFVARVHYFSCWVRLQQLFDQCNTKYFKSCALVFDTWHKYVYILYIQTYVYIRRKNAKIIL